MATLLPVEMNWETCTVDQQADINVKSPQDKTWCQITGLEFLEASSLLLADFHNGCIKRVDIDTGKLDGYLQLQSDPWDITMLPGDRAAVTVPALKEINIICTKGDLSLLYAITVNGQCRGISSTTDGKLVVSYFDPVKIEVLDERGTVLSEVINDVIGGNFFSKPFYVCVAMENKHEVIYVSDVERNALMTLSMFGEVVSTVSDQDMSFPNGLTAIDEHILICGWNSHVVFVVSSSGEKVRPLLSEKDHEIRHPVTVCYNRRRKILYVGCYLNDTIKVYHLH